MKKSLISDGVSGTNAWTVAEGDCLVLMRAMPTGHVDMTLTSPPYEDARLYKPLEFTASGQDWVDWMIPRVVEMCRITDGLVLINMAGKRRDWKYSPVVEWLVADLTRHHGIVCGPAPYCFYRIGIPGSGSGKYHRRDWEPVYAFARAECCPPKWTDNTALGHPPKWAPGGEMSNRLSDGTRANQWGGSYPPDSESNSRTAAGDRTPKFRPSHKLSGRNEWGTTSTNGFRTAERRPDGSRKKDNDTRRLEQDNEDGSCATQPVLADPGNVIQEKYTAEQVAEIMGETNDVVKCLVGGGVMGNRLCHENEAPFPESLAEFFVLSYCPPGGIVFDPFCGSGTTLSVAWKYERRAIGIDARASQVELTRRRLAATQPNLF